MELNVEQNKQEFIRRFKENLGHREGANELLNFISSPKRDFFTAPASANDVLAVKGGACQYALLLNDCVSEMFQTGVYAHALQFKDDHGHLLVTKEAIAVATLLSALDNMMVYATEYKNRKTYDKEVIARAERFGEIVRTDTNGEFVWESYQSYAYDDTMPLGSGVRAISFVQAFMPLKKEELLALRWAKSFSPSNQDKGLVYSALNKSILATALQSANITVRFLLANEAHFDYYQNVFHKSSIATTPSFDENNLKNIEEVIPQVEEVVEVPVQKVYEETVPLPQETFVQSTPSARSVDDEFLKEMEELDKMMFGTS